MSKFRKTYSINSIQQLIDLNQDSKNFKLTFKCESKNPNDKYQILVLNQSQLDSQDSNKVQYKNVTHRISGNIQADKDIYQNYFLVIKSDKDCIVDIEIDKQEIPPNIPNNPPNIPNNPPNYLNSQNNSKNPTTFPKKTNKSFLRSNLFLWSVILIIGGMLLYYIFFTKLDKTKKKLNYNMNTNVHGGSVHGGSVHGGSVHGGSVHGGGGSVHGGSVHGGSVHGGSVHGGSVHLHTKKRANLHGMIFICKKKN